MPRPHGSSTKGKHIKHSEFVLPKGAACLACKARKVRCSGEGQGVCASCVRHARHEGKDISECVCEWTDKKVSTGSRRSKKHAGNSASSAMKARRSQSPSNDSDGHSSEGSASPDIFDLEHLMGSYSSSASSTSSPIMSQISIPSLPIPQVASPLSSSFDLPLTLPPLILPPSGPSSYFAPDLPLYFPSTLSSEDSPFSTTSSYVEEPKPASSTSTFFPPLQSTGEMTEADILALLSLPSTFSPGPPVEPMDSIDYSQLIYPSDFQPGAFATASVDELWGKLLMA